MSSEDLATPTTETKRGRPPKQVQPKIKMKNAISKHHHLFKAEVAPVLKNVSFRPGNPEIVKIEHCHFFHTIDSRLKEQRYTTPTNNHYHEVKWFVDSDGELRAECGPPIRKVQKTRRDGSTYSVEGEISYKNEYHDRNNMPADIVDDHTHDMTYVGSELLSPKIIKSIQEKTAAHIAEQMGGG
jgi:hypothetical protein